MQLSSLVPQIWAEELTASLYRGLVRPNESLEETKVRLRQQFAAHEKRLAEDPEYARKYEEMEREWSQRRAEEECECA